VISHRPILALCVPLKDNSPDREEKNHRQYARSHAPEKRTEIPLDAQRLPCAFAPRAKQGPAAITLSSIGAAILRMTAAKCDSHYIRRAKKPGDSRFAPRCPVFNLDFNLFALHN
jgi:hypothetical protein